MMPRAALGCEPRGRTVSDMRPQFPRLIDIAEKVGESAMSVSRILRGQRLDGYAEATRDRVRRAAEEMGWRPNLIGRTAAAALELVGSGRADWAMAGPRG